MSLNESEISYDLETIKLRLDKDRSEELIQNGLD
jgi:hypothetical protein